MTDLDIQAPVFDIEFHQEKDLLGVCSVSGAVNIYRHNWENEARPFETVHSLKEEWSVRTIDFNDQECVALGLKDGTVCVKEITRMTDKFRVNGETGEAINALTWMTSDVLVSGDEDGDIRMYDCRQPKPIIATWDDCDEQIFDFAVKANLYKLYAASGDKLAVFDLRKPGSKKLFAMSDEQEHDILSIDLFKDERRIVCGMGSGDVTVFFEDDYGDIKDQIPDVSGRGCQGEIESNSVDCVYALTDDIGLAGCGDGRLYTLYLYPNKVCGTVGAHLDEMSDELRPEYAGIDRISVDRHQKVIATSSASSSFVRFFDASIPHTQAHQVVDLENKPTLQTTNAFFDEL